ncbi:Bromodomain-containing protein [Mollisia scopiformis]|uniref:Bromodomain-containing protein n=1 Tax=Mollisia scopiformis TaxID=149040 RepID=A0A132BDQ7_MOLSC|nr:Bromodomain-containing protein [Mollisia scopiformis]KUJ10383.1 Bromodomain-containing protein [Mollisia scopiformis]
MILTQSSLFSSLVRQRFLSVSKRTYYSVELIVRLPGTDVDTFGCFQNFIYTGHVYDKAGGKAIPEYPLLMNIWKLATHLRMAALRVAVLDAMAERRQLTSYIPGPPLLIQAWKETEEGSGLRIMLIRWTAEHMRTSPEARTSFAKSLPQEILYELVLTLSDLSAGPIPATQHHHHPQHPQLLLPAAQPVHDLEPPRPSTKRSRKTDVGPHPGPDDAFDIKPIKKQARRSEPARRNTNNSRSAAVEPAPLTPEKELAFCRDLITRMVSGPGFWTRLVAHFKHPVDPVASNMPNYFAVVKRPMSLMVIKGKMDRNEYATSAEFLADIHQIFQNCYEYWTNEDQVFKDCERLQKYFNEQWDDRHKWVSKIKAEVID